MAYAFMNPSNGNSVPTKKNSAVTGPRPIRPRTSQSVNRVPTAVAG